MTQKKKALKRMAAVVMAAATIIGPGTPAGLPGLSAGDTAITASAASSIFSESCKMADFLKRTAEDEAEARAVLKNFSEFADYEEPGYSAMCTKGLETNYIILYNSAHADFEAALNTGNGQKWAKTYSKLLTTLYQLSGSDRENLIVIFNTDIPSNYPGVAYGPRLNINGTAVFDAIGAILNNTFTWCILHETSHCFSGSGKGLANTLFNSEEDVYTNFRFTCALHYMGLDTKPIVMVDYTSRWNRDDSDLNVKYKKLGTYWMKDSEYDKYFPEGRIWWDEKYDNYSKDAQVSVLQYMASATCGDDSRAHLFNRYAAILSTAADKPVYFSYDNDPENCNNWMNTDKINANWATITEDEWKKFYAMNIAYPENAGLPDIGDEVMVLYNGYLSKMTETVRYGLESDEPCSVKVTPTVQKELQKHFEQGDGVYRYPGTVLQTLNMFEFMGVDIEKFRLLYRDSEKKVNTATAAEFYSSVFIDPDNRGFTLIKTDPPITGHPDNYVVPAGDTAKYTVRTSSDDMTYKWQINSGSEWRDSKADGVDTPTVSFTAEPGYDGNRYRCIVTYPNGEYEISKEVKVKIGVKITEQPADVEFIPGDKVLFSVAASGARTLSYQWQYNEGDGWKDSIA